MNASSACTRRDRADGLSANWFAAARKLGALAATIKASIASKGGVERLIVYPSLSVVRTFGTNGCIGIVLVCLVDIRRRVRVVASADIR